jgi:dienelactone hydrolase
VLAAYAFTRKLPYVDASRIILAGQSAGGVAALYAAAQAPEGLVAVISFAAGRGADPARPAFTPSSSSRASEATVDGPYTSGNTEIYVALSRA